MGDIGDDVVIRTSGEEPRRGKQIDGLLRVGLALLIVLPVVGYTVAVISGAIPENNELSAAHLALLGFAAIAVVLIVRPRTLESVQSLSVGGVNVRLRELRARQDDQGAQLRLLQEVLPLLLPKSELSHLRNLRGRRTTQYRGSPVVRDELRHLRAIGLIRGTVGTVPDEMFDLADYVDLTELGRRLLTRVAEIEASSETAPER